MIGNCIYNRLTGERADGQTDSGTSNKESVMPLTNFGSILNFAEELEIQDQEFYQLVAQSPACSDLKDVFSQFAADAAKNKKTVQRIRRENVTEMILESVSDFTRAPFCEACEGAASMQRRGCPCHRAPP